LSDADIPSEVVCDGVCDVATVEFYDGLLARAVWEADKSLTKAEETEGQNGHDKEVKPGKE
jgi:hypothetical protein